MIEHLKITQLSIQFGEGRKERKVVEKIEELLPERSIGTQKISLHDTVLLQNEGGLRLNVSVVSREVIGKEFAILKDGVDRLAKESWFTTEVTHDGAVARFVAPDDHLR